MAVARAGWLLAALTAAGAAPAAAPVQFSVPAELKESGVALRVPRDASPQLLAPPTLRIRTWSDGRQEEEVCRIAELWMRAQYRGCWQDKAGRRLVLGEVRWSFPPEDAEKYITPGAIEETAAALKLAPPASDAEWTAWAGAFAGFACRGAPREMPPPIRLRQVRRFDLEGVGGPSFGYAFCFKPNVFKVPPEQWFFAWFAPGGGDARGAADAAKAMEAQFLPALAPIPRQAAAAATASRKFQNPRTAQPFAAAATPGGGRSAEYANSREAVLASIRGTTKWWFVETPHYLLVSDMPNRQAPLVRHLQENVEVLRGAFGKLIPSVRPIEAVSVIRMFGDEAEYLQYVGAAYRGTAGIWMPEKKELVVHPVSGDDLARTREAVSGFVYHEAFHQYLFEALKKADTTGEKTAVWFNEGHAEYFRGAEVRREGVRINEVADDRQRLDRMLAERRADPAPLLRMSDEEFYAGSDETQRDHYALAWALVYYLRRGAPQEKGGPNAGVCERYLAAIREGAGDAGATAAAFAGMDLRRFADEFATFWSTPARVRAARDK